MTNLTGAPGQIPKTPPMTNLTTDRRPWSDPGDGFCEGFGLGMHSVKVSARGCIV